MGGKSKSSQKEETTTNTTTTTTVGDIGFTGLNATDMAAVLEMGSIQRESIISETIDGLLQGAGNAYNQLVGGATDLVHTSESIALAQQESSLKAIEAGTMAANPELLNELNLNKALPYIAVGIALYSALKKR